MSTWIRSTLGAVLTALLLTSSLVTAAPAQAALGPRELPALPAGMCAPDWSADFGHEPGVGSGSGPGDVYASAVFDDGQGDGPVLYVGGIFSSAGGKPANRIARWDGSEWSEPGGGVDHHIYTMVVMPVNGTPTLFVGGQFENAGGAPASFLATWDGMSWGTLGAGADDAVWALDVIPDATPVLMVGGDFTSIDGVSASHAAIWAPGSGFFAFGAGFDDRVNTFAVHDGEIYAGGFFTSSNGSPTDSIARWNGSLWEDLGGGLDGVVDDLLSWGSGATYGLYVCGVFNAVGGGSVPASDIARWHAGTWSAVDFPFFDTTRVFALLPWDDGGGDQLYATGWFGNPGSGYSNGHVASYDGVTWTAVGTGVDLPSRTLAVHDDGSGESLWVGGGFRRAGDRGASAVARWDGSAWYPTEDGLNDDVLALHTTPLFGGVETVFVGGEFSVPGQIDDRHIATWQAGAWSSLGGADGPVRAFAEFDDGGGAALYAGGDFTTIGGVPALHLARWDGATWAAVDMGTDGPVHSLFAWDDGSGEALYVGGEFTVAGGISASAIARWDGATFTALGAGLTSVGVSGAPSVRDATTYDDGSGEALFVGGSFTDAGGLPAPGIARWDGATWSALGSGLTPTSASIAPIAHALEVFDDGSGARLFVGGSFSSAGGVPGTQQFSCWDGSAWANLPGAFFSAVQCLEAYADPASGCGLIVGGFVTLSEFGQLNKSQVARFDGSSWSTLDVDGEFPTSVVRTFGRRDDGDGPVLLLGGSFTRIGDTPASYLAAYDPCWSSVSAWVDLGSGLTGSGFGPPLLLGTGSLALGSTNQLNLLFANPFATAGLFLSFTSTPVPFAGGTLVPFPFLDPIILNVDPVGQILIDYDVTECLPPGVPIYAQWAIQDGGAPFGLALSNAVVGTTP